LIGFSKASACLAFRWAGAWNSPYQPFPRTQDAPSNGPRLYPVAFKEQFMEEFKASKAAEKKP
jgi:hypothetical protein